MRIRSLTARFVLTLLLSTALPFLVFGVIVRVGMRERLEAQVVRVLLANQSALLAKELDGLTASIYRDASLIELAARKLLADGDVNAFERELDLLPGFHSDFQVVLVADAHGEVRVTIDTFANEDGARAARESLTPATVADADWFRATLAESRSLVWADRHLSAFLHRNPERTTRNPSDYSIGLALRVAGDGDVGGVLHVLVPWQRVQQIADGVTEQLRSQAGFAGAVASVCDPAARVLACSDRERYVGHELGETLAAAVRIATPEPAIVTFADASGVGAMAGVARVERGAERGLDWRGVVEVPSQELFATVRDFDRVLIGLTVFVVGTLVVWSLLVSRAILRPVRDLAQATRDIARGDVDVRVRVRGRDELAALARSFNGMSAQLAQSREQLRQAAQEAAWAEMARQVAHEIKNPLTPMRMSAQLVQRARRDGDPRVQELVDRLARTVIEQTDQLARIATDFRQFAGKRDLELAEFSADELCDDLAGLFAAEQEAGGASLSFQRDAGAARLRADRGELRRALLNLVQNALQAAGPGGHVVVRSSREDDGRLAFVVRDDGPGMDEATRARLFEPYFTTRSAGTGLGLAISRRIVEAHGGSIGLLRAEPGCTEFRILLPGLPLQADPANGRS
ncbi:MAG: sensor histidine kinase [Planctomycetes bacterium]|nr:sensor histidine kinase [Planctomycetota bacterium]